LEDEELLVVVTSEPSIKIYQVKEGDPIYYLRSFKGGHGYADITCADYCNETLHLITASIDGIVCLWSLEHSKLEYCFCEENSKITVVRKAFPFRAIIAANTNGYILCWRTEFKKDEQPLQFKISFLDSSLGNMDSISINSFLLKRIKYVEVKSKGNHMITRYREKPLTTDTLLDSYTAELNPLYKGTQKSLRLNLEDLKEIKKKGLENTVALDRMDDYSDSEEASGDTQDPYKKHTNLVLILADSWGRIHTIIIDHLLKKANISEYSNSKYHKDRFRRFEKSLNRKDNLNADTLAEGYLRRLRKLNKLITPQIIPGDLISNRSWIAHQKEIKSLLIVKGTSLFTSCSEDKFIKVWDLWGSKKAKISLVDFTQREWEFPYNWIKLKLQELDIVYQTIEQRSGRVISEEERSQLTIRFFYRNHIIPHLKKIKDEKLEQIQLEAKQKRTKKNLNHHSEQSTEQYESMRNAKSLSKIRGPMYSKKDLNQKDSKSIEEKVISEYTSKLLSMFDRVSEETMLEVLGQPENVKLITPKVKSFSKMKTVLSSRSYSKQANKNSLNAGAILSNINSPRRGHDIVLECDLCGPSKSLRKDVLMIVNNRKHERENLKGINCYGVKNISDAFFKQIGIIDHSKKELKPPKKLRIKSKMTYKSIN